MNQYAAVGILAALVVVLFVGMVLAWRAHRRRDERAGSGYRISEPGEAVAEIEAFAVATTAHGQPVQRRIVGPLGFPARARVRVTTAAVTILIPGEEPVQIAASAIREVATATVAIDRAVEPGGLVVIAWRLDGDAGEVVDSYFRVVDPADDRRLIEAVTRIAPSPNAAQKG